MLPYEVILKKRNGLELSKPEIETFVRGFTDGSIPDYQMAALLMAIYYRGMTAEETTHLTDVMVASGARLDPAPGKVTADKHSTGGVGDKVSLPLIGLLAACDVAVPMISGRGLGHTGGTLDKMEAIPGYRTALSEREFLDQMDRIGMALASQTANLVPADKKMYSLRDVTATVDSIPLISASIMSKKIAEGASHLILDVKTGCGAFMRTEEDAEALARSMVAIGQRIGLDVRAVLTDMNQPTGFAVGNAIEVNEAVALLAGGGPDDLRTITLFLAGSLLVMTGKVSSIEDGRELLERKIADGSGLDRFKTLILAQGGDPSFMDRKEGLPLAAQKHVVIASRTGYCAGIDPVRIGFATTLLGGGRKVSTDEIDHRVGMLVHVKIGQSVSPGQPLTTVYFSERDAFHTAIPYIENAFSWSETEVAPLPLIRKVIDRCV